MVMTFVAVAGINGAGKTTALRKLIHSRADMEAVTHGTKNAGAWVSDGTIAVLGRWAGYHNDTGSAQVGRADGMCRVFNGPGTAAMYDALGGRLRTHELVVADGSKPLAVHWIEALQAAHAAGELQRVELLQLDTSADVALQRQLARDAAVLADRKAGAKLAAACADYAARLPQMMATFEAALGIKRRVVTQHELDVHLQAAAAAADVAATTAAGATSAAVTACTVEDLHGAATAPVTNAPPAPPTEMPHASVGVLTLAARPPAPSPHRLFDVLPGPEKSAATEGGAPSPASAAHGAPAPRRRAKRSRASAPPAILAVGDRCRARQHASQLVRRGPFGHDSVTIRHFGQLPFYGGVVAGFGYVAERDAYACIEYDDGEVEYDVLAQFVDRG